ENARRKTVRSTRPVQRQNPVSNGTAARCKQPLAIELSTPDKASAFRPYRAHSLLHAIPWPGVLSCSRAPGHKCRGNSTSIHRTIIRKRVARKALKGRNILARGNAPGKGTRKE
ncbi:MAG TPA: hypothetical protein PLK12_10035, partial [Prolixibacteraceae bacterium]|nr:hypothetical protein [Prolixibacteraceae bacterium]